MIVGIVAGVALFHHSKSVEAPESISQNEMEPVADSSFDSGLSQSVPTLGGGDTKTKAWAVLQKYLGYAKNHDLKNLRQVSYQLSPACSDPAQEKNCFERMDTAYFFGSFFKQEDFKYVWSDERQIILATEFNIEEDDTMMGRNRAMIYFVVVDGNPKVLYFNPTKGSVVSKGTASKEELTERLVIYTEDKDEDGKEDYLEQCLSSSQNSSCVKTDPKIRDTDKDGFWDGIETLFH